MMRRNIVRPRGFFGREESSPLNYRADSEFPDLRWMKDFQENSGNSGDFSASARVRTPQRDDGLVWCAGRMPAKGRWIGLKCHVLGLELDADLEMHLASNGYVGLAKVEQDKINVCGLFRLEPNLSGKGIETLERYLCAGGLDVLAARILAARVDAESFLGVAGFRLGWQETRDGIAALGDAWAMIPPFTGNGMSMAFESAEIAADRCTPGKWDGRCGGNPRADFPEN